jgi:hypothetical protein
MGKPEAGVYPPGGDGRGSAQSALECINLESRKCPGEMGKQPHFTGRTIEGMMEGCNAGTQRSEVRDRNLKAD